MSSDKIPFIDLRSQHQNLEQEFMQAFKSVLDSDRFIGGAYLEGFESSFATFCGTKHAIGVGNGTDALRFALIACGIKNGDIVITVPNTFIATSEAISQAGGNPVFVDVEENTSNMSNVELRKYLEENCFLDTVTGETINTRSGKPVRAIVPVHLYGQMADMDSISETALQYNLVIVEDACQAHGAQYYSQIKKCWMRAGSVGRAAAFSFYPGKNLGAFGEAGAITTNDDQVAETVRMLRDHGQIAKYIHEIEGYNGRLDSIQAAVLAIKLPNVNKWNDSRRTIAKKYFELLSPLSNLTIPKESAWSQSVYHLYVVHHNRRDALKAYLLENGIETGLHYPVPLHLQKAYRSLGYRLGSFPVSEKLANNLLSLPMHPFLNDDHIRRIADTLEKFCKSDQN
jgi:dTDP-4-amino-4,6-dideoxygalactose transaminase